MHSQSLFFQTSISNLAPSSQNRPTNHTFASSKPSSRSQRPAATQMTMNASNGLSSKPAQFQMQKQPIQLKQQIQKDQFLEENRNQIGKSDFQICQKEDHFNQSAQKEYYEKKVEQREQFHNVVDARVIQNPEKIRQQPRIQSILSVMSQTAFIKKFRRNEQKLNGQNQTHENTGLFKKGIRKQRLEYSLNYSAAYSLPGDNRPNEHYMDQQMVLNVGEKQAENNNRAETSENLKKQDVRLLGKVFKSLRGPPKKSNENEKPGEKRTWGRLLKNLFYWMAAYVIGGFASGLYQVHMKSQLAYSAFIALIQQGKIAEVVLGEGLKTARFKAVDGSLGFCNLIPGQVEALQTLMLNKKVMFAITSMNPIVKGILAIAPWLIGYMIAGTVIGNMQQAQSKGVSKFSKDVQAEMTGKKFSDVAGIDEAKSELQEVVTILKNPEVYTRLGAKIPKGVLLSGPPGTGKTLLAKAVAGEAGVPFLAISASEINEVYFGVGASRIRDLFKKAKESAPSIIFIDELDTIGRQRGGGGMSRNDEMEQTINQLLTEMDGFGDSQGVVVLAATNMPETLDSALMRPGRFDRQVQVQLPDLEGRTAILAVHSEGKAISDSVDMKEVAKRCIGMSGADLQNLLNEAAIFSARKEKFKIESDDIYDALDRIQLGLERKGTAKFSAKRMKTVAYHEAGHALLGALMEEYDLVNKISVVPRGQSGGMTVFTPQEEIVQSGLYSKNYLQDRICVAMGGRIAEEIVNGKDNVTSGASGDFQQCTQTAKQMVEQLGMSEAIGPRTITQSNNMYGISQDGQNLKNLADKEIDKILADQYKRGMKVLSNNKVILDDIAESLIDKEKLTGVDLLDIIRKYDPELISDDKYEQAKTQIAQDIDDTIKSIDEQIDEGTFKALNEINKNMDEVEDGDFTGKMAVVKNEIEKVQQDLKETTEEHMAQAKEILSGEEVKQHSQKMGFEIVEGKNLDPQNNIANIALTEEKDIKLEEKREKEEKQNANYVVDMEKFFAKIL